MSRNYNSAPENDGDGSDGYDGSRESISDINDNNPQRNDCSESRGN